MGKSGGTHGGRRSRTTTALSAAIIKERIEKHKLGHFSPNEIADHLYSAFTEYKHYKLTPFRLKINQILKQHPMKKRKIDNTNVSSIIDKPKSPSITAISATSDGEEEVDMVKSMLRESYNNNNYYNSNNEEINLLKNVVEKFKDDKGEGARFREFGGIKKELDKLEIEVLMPLRYPNLMGQLNLKRKINYGILLYGPPGCGKTRLALAIANESGFPLYMISAPELVSGVSGESEEKIRELFSKAYKTAPSIVFIDEIDAIASNRVNLQRQTDQRIVTQLMTCMDESHKLVEQNGDTANVERSGSILVIGATNRPEVLDPALRRCGRFDKEILLPIPDVKARADILSSLLTSNARLDGDIDVTQIARATSGFVSADLVKLVYNAGSLALKRFIDHRRLELCNAGIELVADQLDESQEDLEKFKISMVDFKEAAKNVQPSLLREGFSVIPNVTWEDVGGLNELRKEFERHIVWSIKYPELVEKLGLESATGYLLFGPPGCGKTLIAKALAHEAGANFIHVQGPELLNKYVGESEAHIRMIFHRARTCSPCILFFDEVDALTTECGKEGGSVVDRLLKQLLIELDGGEDRRGVYVIGATNRPEVVDKALLRPGRFGKPLYVPLPKPDERGLILKALARKKPVDASVNLIDLGRSEICENFSGADLVGLMKHAALALGHEMVPAFEAGVLADTDFTIKHVHFELARTRVAPSVSEEQKQYYDMLSKSFGAT